MSGPPLISVVDDDDSVRESLQGFIRSVGFAVEAFASGEALLKSDRISDMRCLILDMRMPTMNGLEVQRRLAASGCEVPVIFITAHEDDQTRSLAIRRGAVNYLLKPLSEESLLNAIQTALEQNM
jgi:FixJ family two-component response regulator